MNDRKGYNHIDKALLLGALAGIETPQITFIHFHTMRFLAKFHSLSIR